MRQTARTTTVHWPVPQAFGSVGDSTLVTPTQGRRLIRQADGRARAGGRVHRDRLRKSTEVRLRFALPVTYATPDVVSADHALTELLQVGWMLHRSVGMLRKGRS